MSSVGQVFTSLDPVRATRPVAPQLVANTGLATSSAGWLAGLRAAAARGGAPAVRQYLAAGGSAGPLKGLLATPQGRAALIGFALGLEAGFALGVKERAAFDVLGHIAANDELSIGQKSALVADVMAGLFVQGPSQSQQRPSEGDRIAQQRAVQSLRTSVHQARLELAEARKLYEQLPDDSNRAIVRAKQSRLATLEGQLRQLEARPKAPVARPQTSSNPVKTPAASTPNPAARSQYTLASKGMAAQAQALAHFDGVGQPIANGNAAVRGFYDSIAGGSATKDGIERAIRGVEQTRNQLQQIFKATQSPAEQLDAARTALQRFARNPANAKLKAPNLEAVIGQLKADGAALGKAREDLRQGIAAMDTWLAHARSFAAGKTAQLPVPPTTLLTESGGDAAADQQRLLEAYERAGRSLQQQAAQPLPATEPKAPTAVVPPGTAAHRPTAARAWFNPATGGVAAQGDTRHRLGIEVVDTLPGRRPSFEVWVHPNTGAVSRQDPRDGVSVRMEVESSEKPRGEVKLGGVPGKDPNAQIVLYVKPPKGPKPGDVVKWLAIFGPSLLLTHHQLDQLVSLRIDTATTTKQNNDDIARIDGNTPLQKVTETRNTIYKRHLDNALAALGGAKQGGLLFWAGRFSREELASLKRQVDDFKAELDKQPPPTRSDVQQPTLRFAVNPTFDDAKKTEAATQAFNLANELAMAESRQLALRYFGGSDQTPAIRGFDVQALIGSTPVLREPGAGQAKALAAGERQIWRHYLSQLPALMNWSVDSALARSHTRDTERWLANDANFVANGEPLDPKSVNFAAATVYDATIASDVALRLSPLQERARQDIQQLRQKVGTGAEVPAKPDTQISDLLAQKRQETTQARQAVQPFLAVLDQAEKDIAAVAPGDALPAALALPESRGPVERTVAQALSARLAAADAALQGVEARLKAASVASLRQAQSHGGEARDRLLETHRLIEARIGAVRALRGELRSRNDELLARAQTVPAPQPTTSIEPVPVPTEVPGAVPQQVLPSPDPLPTPMPEPSETPR